MTQELAAVLSTFKDYSQTVNNLWAVLQVVGLAILGFAFKETYIRENIRFLAVLTVLFLGFGYGNREALLRAQEVVWTANEQLHDPVLLAGLHPSLRAVAVAHSARTTDHIRYAHWLFSIAIVIGLWLPYLFASRQLPDKLRRQM